MKDTDAFFTPEPARYTFTKAPESIRAAGEEGVLTFSSGLTTPHPENNTVVARYFPARPFLKPRPGAPRRAVVVLAQWNADADGHIGLCKILSRLGIASLRISLPYHDARRPPELVRADYIVSSNIVRTLQVNRQAVRDVRLALWWLRDQGYRTARPAGHEPGVVPVVPDDLPRAAGARAGAQSRVAVFRRRRLARPLHRARAARARWPRRRRSAAQPLAPDQPVVVHRAAARQADADGLCEVRPVVPRRSVVDLDQRDAAPPLSPAGERAAVRSLLDRRGAVQVSRRVVSREVSGESTVPGFQCSRVPRGQVRNHLCYLWNLWNPCNRCSSTEQPTSAS